MKKPQPYTIQEHLRVAINNALWLFVLAFIEGMLAGWALSRWASAPIGAGVGTLIAMAIRWWVMRMYYLTRGLLHTIEKWTPEGQGDPAP